MAIKEGAGTYLNTLEAQDLETISSLLADAPTIDIPFSNTGELAPQFTFEGGEQALGYIRHHLPELQPADAYRTHDLRRRRRPDCVSGSKGDLIQRDTNANYRNVYVFKLSTQDGRITHVREYANPLTFAKLMGIPLG